MTRITTRTTFFENTGANLKISCSAYTASLLYIARAAMKPFAERVFIAFMVAAAVFIITSTTLVVLNQVDYPGWWNNTVFQNTSGLCEQAQGANKLLREPYNALSSLFYVFPTMFAFVFRCADSCSKEDVSSISIMSTKRAFSFVWYLLNLGMTVGTVVNHACSCVIGSRLDNYFTWQLLLAPSVFMASLVCPANTTTLVWELFCIWALILTPGLALTGPSSTIQYIVTPMLLVTLIVFGIVVRTRKEIKGYHAIFWVGLAFAAMGACFVALDKVICTSGRTFGSHSLFHVFTAIALVLLYCYLWSLRYAVRDEIGSRDSRGAARESGV